MIEEKLAFINNFDESTFISKEKANDLFVIKCPKCGSHHVVRNGHYTRKTLLVNNEVETTVIQKYVCKSCDTSLKYLPLYLSTYSHLSSLLNLKILISNRSINKLSKLFNVTRSTIRSIKKRFNNTLKELMVLVNKYQSNSFLDILNSYKSEFNHYLFSPSTISTNYKYLLSNIS